VKSPRGLAPGAVAWLSRLAPASVWRDILAFLTGFLTVATLSGGLVYWLPWLQVGVIAGIAMGLVATSTRRAAAVAAAAVVLGILAGPSSSWQALPDVVTRLWQGGVMVLVAASVAAAVRALAPRRRWLPRLLTWVALAVIVGNLWATALTVNGFAVQDSSTGQRMPSLNEQLRGSIPDIIARSDNAFYFNVYRSMRGGQDYYTAFDSRYREAAGTPASSVLNVRLPLLYWVWTALPGPDWVVYLFLGLSSGAALGVVPLVSRTVKLPLAIPAAAAICAYSLAFATQFAVFSQEPWAGALAVLGVAAMAVSWRSERWIPWAAAGVAALVVGTLVRETLAPVMVAGLVSVLWAPASRRMPLLGLWAAGWIVLGSAYAAHWSRARALIDPSSAAGRFGAGSVAFMLGSLEYATIHLGPGGWLPWVLAVLGLAGAGIQPRPAMRVMVLGGVAATLAAFLLVANSATASSNGAVVNYWGATFVPLLYACVPFALLVVPGAASAQPDAAGSPR
jgi:hypothetical protein